MSDALAATVRAVVADHLRLPPESLTGGTVIPFEDDIEDELLWERLTEATGVDPEPIHESYPDLSTGLSGWVLASLRKLAPFSDAARAELERLDPGLPVMTLASLTESLRLGRWVESGLQGPPLHPPWSALGVVLWLSTILFGVLALSAIPDPCNPACRICDPSDWGAFRRGLLVWGPLGGLVILTGILPGHWHLHRRSLVTRAAA